MDISPKVSVLTQKCQ